MKLKAEPTFLFKGLRRQAHTAERVKTQDPRVKKQAFLFFIALFFQDTRHFKAEVCMLQLYFIGLTDVYYPTPLSTL